MSESSPDERAASRAFLQRCDVRLSTWLAGLFALWAYGVVFAVGAPVRRLDSLLRSEEAASPALSPSIAS